MQIASDVSEGEVWGANTLGTSCTSSSSTQSTIYIVLFNKRFTEHLQRKLFSSNTPLADPLMLHTEHADGLPPLKASSDRYFDGQGNCLQLSLPS